MANKPANWDTMTPEEKRTYRLDKFRNSGQGVEFVSPQSEKNYNIRVKRLIDVYNVQKPDRIPLDITASNLPLAMEGLDTRTIFYEPRKACEAAMRFNKKYSEELETFAMPMTMIPGEVMDILDYKLYVWPGHGLPDNSGNWQYVEGEYMTADEYDDLIRDPSDFWLRKYLPRVLGAFEGFSMFQPFTNIAENVHLAGLRPFSTDPVKNMFRTFIKAGEAFERNSAELARYRNIGLSHGFPSSFGAICLAPFDILGDTLRGTANIMMDMFRRPDKLLAALDVITEITITNVLDSPGIDDIFMVRFPLHKGADGWMSQAQFDKFYWPSLKKCIDAFIKEGLIHHIFAEGSYNTRLDYINQFPKGSVTWFFDQTDMARAKQVLGKQCCIQGNVPASIIVTSEPSVVYDYCRNLIEVAGKDGGFILSPGAHPENPRLENLRAMVEAVNKYGYYT